MPYASTLNAAAANAGPSLTANIGADVSGLIAGLAMGDAALKLFSGSLDAAGIAAMAGFAAVTAGAVAIGGAITASIGEAVKFQTLENDIRNNTTMTAADMGAMHDGILKLAGDTGSSFDQLGAGFQHIVNLTGSAKYAMDELTVANESAVSTGGNVAQVADVLSRALHEYALATSSASTATAQHAEVQANAARVMGIFHLAAAESNQTLEQFAENSARAVGVAANLHVPIEQVSAAMADLTIHGYNSAEAQTQVVNIMTHLIKPAAAAEKEIVKLSKATGVDLVSDFSAGGLATKGLTGIMADLETAYGKMGYSTATATGETMKLLNAQRGGLGMATLLGTGAADYTKILGDLTDTTKTMTVTHEAFLRTQQTVGFQWEVLKEQVKVASEQLGEHFLPAVSSVLGFLSGTAVPGLTHATLAFGEFVKPVTDAAQAIMHAQDPFKELLNQVDKVSPKLGLLISVAHDVATSFGANGIGGGIQTLAHDLALFGPAGQVASTALGVLIKEVATDMPAMKSAAKEVADWFKGPFVSELKEGFDWLAHTAMPVVKAEFVNDWPAIKGVMAEVANWTKGTLWPDFKEVFGWLAETGIPQVTNAFVAGWPQDKAAVKDVYDYLHGTVFPFLNSSFGGLSATTLPGNAHAWAESMGKSKLSAQELSDYMLQKHDPAMRQSFADQGSDLKNFGSLLEREFNSWSKGFEQAGLDVHSKFVVPLGADFAMVIGNMSHFKQDWIDTWHELTDGTAAEIGHIEADVNAIPGRLTAALGDLGSLFIHAGQSLMTGLASGISAGWATIQQQLSSITSALPSWKGPPEKDAMILYDSGRLVMQGFQHGLEDSMPAVTQSLSMFTARLAPAASGAPAAAPQGSAAVASSLGATVGDFVTIGGDFNKQQLAAATAFADTASKVVSLVTSGIDALVKLKDYKPGLSRDAVVLFSDDIAGVVATLEVTTRGFEKDGLAHASLFADTASKVTGLISSGVDALVKLATYKPGLSRDAVVLFANDMAGTVATLEVVARTFQKDALDHAVVFAEAAGKVVGIIGGAVDAFVKLSTYKGVAPNLLDWFGADLRSVITKLVDVTQHVEKDGVAAAAQLADGIGKIVAPISSSVDALGKLSAYKGVAPNLLDWFGGDMILLINKMGDIAYRVGHDGLKSTTDFATAVTGLTTAVTDGIKAIETIDNYKGLASGKMDAFQRDFVTVVSSTAALARDGAIAEANAVTWRDEMFGMMTAYSAGTAAISGRTPTPPSGPSGSSGPASVPPPPVPTGGVTLPPVAPSSPGPVIPGGMGARGADHAPGNITVQVIMPNVTTIGNQQDVQTLAYQIGQELQRRK